MKIPIDIISAKMLQIRTTNTKTGGAARQEKNTSPFQAIKYKVITLLSLRKPTKPGHRQTFVLTSTAALMVSSTEAGR